MSPCTLLCAKLPKDMKRIAIIGGGIAGVTAAYELARLAREGAAVEATLFEASSRLGGIVETIREGGFIIEGGPDGWVTEKPWARELAEELGLAGELLPSNDATRRTYILKDNVLQAIPDGLKMMVPTNLEALNQSNLFSEAARQAFRDEAARAAELKATAPVTDESVADFVRRHFGSEVLETIAAPLLSGVFGGDVANLSVRAVMAPFVAMEREHGSLITALQSRTPASKSDIPAIFTTLRSGVATLIERMVATLPRVWLRMNSPVIEIVREEIGWTLRCSGNKPATEHFDELMIATPVDVARTLLTSIDPETAALMDMDASSAVIIAFALPDATRFPVPAGFGFLVPPAPAGALANGSEGVAAKPTSSRLLAATFVDQKFDHRVPPGARLIRAFFGGATGERMMRCGNDEVASIARLELARILGPLPDPAITPQLITVRRWPRSLPQYAVGHLDRMAQLDARLAQMPGLYLLGNGYRGVGLPDLIRDSRAAARAAVKNTLLHP
jgi:protoporphyrinogen/coproporphyrinogen III oxidase